MSGRSLTSRVVGVCLVLLVLIGAVGSFALLTLARVAGSTDQLTAAARAEAANEQVMRLMVAADTGIQKYRLSRDPVVMSTREAALAAVPSLLAEVTGQAHASGLELDTTRDRELALAWLGGYARSVAEGEGLGDVAAQRQADADFTRFQTRNAATYETIATHGLQVRVESQQLRRQAQLMLSLLLAAAALIGGVVTFLAVRSLHTPLERLRATLEAWSSGDQGSRAPEDGPRELVQVAVAANALAEQTARLHAEHQQAIEIVMVARDISQQIRHELDPRSVLATAVRALGESLQVDRVWLRTLPRLWGPGQQPQLFEWTRPGMPDQAPPELDIAVTLPWLRDLVIRNEIFHVPDIELLAAQEAEVGSDPVWQQFHAEMPDLCSLLLAPVPGADDVLAVISLGACQQRPFSRLQRHAVQSVCADLGRALEQSLLFEHQADLLDRLQALDRQKTDFLSTVSHELRTPLTSIRGYVELLEDEAADLPPHVGRVLDVIGRNVNRLGGLIEDLLTLGRIESGAVRFETRTFDVAAAAESVVRALAPQAARAQVNVTLSVPPEPVELDGDETQIERVLLNLANNAVKFTPAGGLVCIEVDPITHTDEYGNTQPWVRIRVTDTGIGIPEVDQANLFNRFYRASNAVQNQIPGTGLGLSIVRRIVDAHRGQVTLTSEPGRGTQFGVVIPRRRALTPDVSALVPQQLAADLAADLSPLDSGHS